MRLDSSQHGFATSKSRCEYSDALQGGDERHAGFIRSIALPGNVSQQLQEKEGSKDDPNKVISSRSLSLGDDQKDCCFFS